VLVVSSAFKADPLCRIECAWLAQMELPTHSALAVRARPSTLCGWQRARAPRPQRRTPLFALPQEVNYEPDGWLRSFHSRLAVRRERALVHGDAARLPAIDDDALCALATSLAAHVRETGVPPPHGRSASHSLTLSVLDDLCESGDCSAW